MTLANSGSLRWGAALPEPVLELLSQSQDELNGTAVSLLQLKALAPVVCVNDVELSLIGASAFSEVEMLQAFQAYIAKDVSLSELCGSASHFAVFKQGLVCMEGNSALALRLFMLRECMPYEFYRTLFCCALVAMESVYFEREESSTQSLFLAALIHDLGLLDVDPKFTHEDHDPRTSKDDERGYYSHAVYSADFLSRHLSGHDKIVKGVLEHHENMDGTGYPNGVSGIRLGEIGQHLHMYDTLYSVYTKNYLPIGKVLADVKPVVEINAVTHFGQVAVRVVALLSQATPSSTVFFKSEQAADIQLKTEEMALYIEKSIGVIQEFTAKVGFRHEDKTLFVLQNSFIHIALAYYKLRIVLKQASLADVLDEGGDSTVLHQAIEQNFLTLREIIFHINKFLYRLRLYVGVVGSGEVLEQAEKTIKSLSDLVTKLVH